MGGTYQDEQPYLRLVEIADGLKVGEPGASEAADSHQDFAGRTAFDVFLEAGVAKLVGFLGVADLLFAQAHLVLAAETCFAGFVNAECELGAQVLIAKAGLLVLGIGQAATLAPRERLGEVPPYVQAQ